MPRMDLLALSVEDLTVLSNRGIVKRAQQEAEGGQFTCILEEDAAGDVIARWSDEVVCELAAVSTLANARCSCPANGLCRHLVRTVFAYQRWQTSRPLDTPTPEILVTGQPWNPGAIGDAALERIFAKKTLALARKLFEEGQVLELVRTAKPTARNHSLGTHLRFLVPHDPRYTHCDCSEPAPCSHVPLAVWAFRELPPERLSGIVSTRQIRLTTPTELLDEIETALAELAHYGLANLPSPLLDRLRRLETRCRTAGLIWPAEILAEMLILHDAYSRHDARFTPLRLAELLAELCIRMDAIRNDTGVAPQLFVRGAKSDRQAEIGSARMVGLGCGVEIHRTGVRLSSYMQDTDTGVVVAVQRDFQNRQSAPTGTTPDAELPPFWQLAQASVLRGGSLASLGGGQLLVKGGKRSPNHEFIFGRAAVNINPQSYQWETLRPPALVEGFDEVVARLSTLPPAPLRPRRLAEDFFLCPILHPFNSSRTQDGEEGAVRGVEGARFVAHEQSIQALLRDPQGGTAQLHHPYTSRGAAGADALLTTLVTRGEEVVFVAGRMHLRGGELRVEPVSLVIESQGRRTLLQPWIDRYPPAREASITTGADSDSLTAGLEREEEGEGVGFEEGSTVAPDPVGFCWNPLMEDIGELLLVGLDRVDDTLLRRWRTHLRDTEALGFVRLTLPLQRLTDGMAARQSTVHRDSTATYRALTEIACGLLLIQAV